MSVSMKPGRHAVDGDVAAADLLRQRLGEADQRRLGGGVVGLAGVAAAADHRGDLDDAAVARLHHAAQHRLRQPEHGLEVGLDDRVPLLVLHPQQQVVARDAGVVDQDRDRRRSCDSIAAERGVDRRGVGDVERACPSPAMPASASVRARSSPRRRRWSPCRRPSRRRAPSASAIARPMPRVAPVTSATCPASSSLRHARPPGQPVERRQRGVDARRRRSSANACEVRRRCACQARSAPCPGRTRRRA